MTYSAIRLTVEERLSGQPCQMPDDRILDFWQWAYSDLRANNVRGVFAKWLVAKLLNIQPPVRESWSAWDLRTNEGVKLEVKAAAYLQAWEQPTGPSRISFAGLRAQTWTLEDGDSGVQTYNADLYIFCTQIEKRPESWNALNLGQWRFDLVFREALQQYGARSIGLSTVRHLAAEAGAADLTAEQFRHRGPQMISEAARR